MISLTKNLNEIKMERSRLMRKINMKDDESQSCVSLSDDSDDENPKKRKSTIPNRRSKILLEIN